MNKLRTLVRRAWRAVRQNPIRSIGYATIGLEQLAVEVPGVKAAAAYRIAVGVVTFLATELGRTKVSPANPPAPDPDGSVPPGRTEQNTDVPPVDGQVGFAGGNA